MTKAATDTRATILPARFRPARTGGNILLRLDRAYRDYRAFKRLTAEQLDDAGLSEEQARALTYGDFFRNR
ncbi:MAG: hypothetical protein ACU0DK_13130 [Pseudooceanicola sp.]